MTMMNLFIAYIIEGYLESMRRYNAVINPENFGI